VEYLYRLPKSIGAFESLAEPDSMSGWSACDERDGSPAAWVVWRLSR
jgi:hypothetical protein